MRAVSEHACSTYASTTGGGRGEAGVKQYEEKPGGCCPEHGTHAGGLQSKEPDNNVRMRFRPDRAVLS